MSERIDVTPELERFCVLQHRDIERRMESQDQKLDELREELREMRQPINDMTAGIRALRWLGGLIVALGILFKTGDLSAALRHVFGSGP